MKPATIAAPLPGIRQEGVTAPSTSKRQAVDFLRRELGVTGAQAHALFDAYRRDQERPTVTSSRTYRLSFLAWLMEQQPGGRSPRKTPKREWRVAS